MQGHRTLNDKDEIIEEAAAASGQTPRINVGGENHLFERRSAMSNTLDKNDTLDFEKQKVELEDQKFWHENNKREAVFSKFQIEQEMARRGIEVLISLEKIGLSGDLKEKAEKKIEAYLDALKPTT
jgi:hypothetical protein